jgi:hypothetical protein
MSALKIYFLFKYFLLSTTSNKHLFYKYLAKKHKNICILGSNPLVSSYMNCKPDKLNFQSLDTNTIKRNQADKTPSAQTSQFARRATIPGLALAAVIATGFPAQAVIFNFTYQPGVTRQQIESVELAGNIWSSYLKDTNVVVNVHFEMSTGVLAAGKLGGSTPAIKKINYDKFKVGLAADGTANINLMPTSNQGQDKYSVRLQNGSINSSYYELLTTTANNKALGNDTSGTASGLDAHIQLEKLTNWSYNYAGGTIAPNQYDFTSVVLHELGHSLGFISGIDALSNLALPSALDMFRYSSQSASQKAIDFTVGGTKYLSTNGGQSAFSVTENINNTTVVRTAQFSTGENISLGGDGDQASHWKVNTQPYLGIMSSTIKSGEIRKISKFDLTAFDYIGWQVNNSATLNLPALLTNAKTKAQTILGSQSNYIYDRYDNVEDMMVESGIYNWKWGSYWQTADSNQSQQVLEPTSMMGFLGLGLLGICSLVKRSSKK